MWQFQRRTRRKEKENEKVEKYQNLARELRRMWEVKTNCSRGLRNGAVAIELHDDDNKDNHDNSNGSVIVIHLKIYLHCN